MFVGEHMRMETLCKKTIRVLLDMVNTVEVNQQLKTLVNDRDQALAYFFRSLIKTSKITIFEQFNGYLGAQLLRSSEGAKQWLSTMLMVCRCVEEVVFTRKKVSP